MSATSPFAPFVGRGALCLLFLSASLGTATAQAAARTQNTLPDLDEGRSGAALVSTQGALYLIGGETAEGVTGRVDRLDLKTRRWETVTDALIPRKHHAAVVVGDEIFVIGGRGDRGAVAEVEVLDTTTGEIWDAPPLPTPRWFVSAALYRGEIFVAGGTQGWGGRKATVEVLDPRRGEWFVDQPLSVARDTKLVVVGKELLALGGFAGDGEVALDIERYARGDWQLIGNMPTALSAFAPAVSGQRIFLLGDFVDTGSALALDRLPLARGGFQKADVRGFQAARHAAAVSVGDRVFVVGGEDARGKKLDTVQMLSAR
jgi:hypothetical protein